MSQLIDRLQTVASALGASDATIGPVEIVSFVKELLQGREIRFETAEPSLLVLADPIRLKEMLVPLLERDPKALSLPPPTICLSAAGGTAEISLETPSPRAFIFVLARAAATSQGGECIQEAKGGRTVVRFRLRCAS